MPPAVAVDHPGRSGEHVALVAIYADLIADLIGYDGDRAALFREALRHDLAEVETGDIPSPVKNRLGPKELRESYEAEILSVRYGINDSTQDSSMHWLIKVADLTEAVMKLTEEFTLGNRSVEDVLYKLVQTLHDVIFGASWITTEQKIAIWKFVKYGMYDEYRGQDGILDTNNSRGAVLFHESLAL